MRHFEGVRSHAGSQHALRRNDPYLISFDLELSKDRHQSIYLAELEDEAERRYLRISTPIGPLADTDPSRCLRFNWQQRTVGGPTSTTPALIGPEAMVAATAMPSMAPSRLVTAASGAA